MARSVGIDLGTTNSVVAVLGGSGDGTTPQIVPLSEGSNLCPSVVGFTRAGGERVVGHLAKRQAITNPERTVSSIKRQMGTAYRVAIDNHSYSPEEISAMILEKLRLDAEEYLGESIDEAVITVPAYFSNAQREATKNAGEIAGIKVVRIINEPTAAALAYGHEIAGQKTLLVWDLGGGTFDVSILDISDGETFEVCATNGDTRLGGDDWDDRVVDHLIAAFAEAHPKASSARPEAVRANLVMMQRIRDAAEKAKIELSTVSVATVNLPFLASGADGAPIHLETKMTRAEFEEITRDLLDRMIAPTEKAMLDAKMDRNKIDRILLVGGSTRMPAVQRLIRTMFDKEPYKGINPDEAVAAGAAIQAGIIHGSVTDLVLIDVTPLSLGIETQGGVFTSLIERNSAIPTSHAQIFTNALDNQSAVDIHVLQGEREFAADNISLGQFQLTGLPPAPRGTARIEVCFDIDTNGIVNVSALDLATERAQHVTVTGSSNLSPREIDRMVGEAQTSREADAKRREETETKNKAEQKIYAAKALMNDAKNKANASQMQKLASAAKNVQDGLNRGDLAFVRRANDSLDDAISDVSRALYGSQAQTASSAARI